VAVRGLTGGPCRSYVHARTHGSRKCVESREVTGITPAQPGETLFAQAGATRPGSVCQSLAASISGERVQEILESS
jgi:hypothetical protein